MGSIGNQINGLPQSYVCSTQLFTARSAPKIYAHRPTLSTSKQTEIRRSAMDNVVFQWAGGRLFVVTKLVYGVDVNR